MLRIMTTIAWHKTRGWLGMEFVLLFVGLPMALAAGPRGRPVLPVLWGAALMCGLYLARGAPMARFEFRRLHGLGRYLPGILARWLATAAVLTVALLVWSPHALFLFPRRRPGIWLLVMLLYPLLSVLPQNLVYRSFLFQRYRPLFPRATQRLLASTFAFGLVHIVFRNPWAILLALTGGWLFARTYARSRSFWLAALEHALYGNLLFTIGIGRFFYHAGG